VKIKGNTRIKLSQAGWFVLGCVLLPLSSFGALFPVTQSSLPAGLVSQSAIIEEGENYTSINPQLNKNGYTFGYWKINGTRQAGADGRSLTQVVALSPRYPPSFREILILPPITMEIMKIPTETG